MKGSVVVRAAAAVLAAAGTLSLWTGTAAGQEWLEMTTARQVSGQEGLSLRVSYGAGDLVIRRAEEDLLYRASLRYDASEFEPIRSYEIDGSRARVRLGLRARDGNGELDVNWDDLDLDLGDLGDLGDLDTGDSGEMELALSSTVPTDLEIVTGASRSEMHLGGIPLTSLEVATGASETVLSFDEPNPGEMSRLALKAGAASLEVRNLGNSRAREIVVESAVGEVELDFSGEWTGDVTARVKTGVGQVVLRIPDDLGVRVEKRSLLSSFTGIGLEESEDGAYRTENWSEAEHHMDLEVEAAFGSIRIVRSP